MKYHNGVRVQVGNLITFLPLFALLHASTSYAQDTDGDGAPDYVDARPSDPSVAAMAYIPGRGRHGTMVFEDTWPSKDDLDFNDLVVAYNFVVRMNTAGQAVSVTATINALANGGLYENGLALQLPVAASSASLIQRRIG
jgi:hypothetical protein